MSVGGKLGNAIDAFNKNTEIKREKQKGILQDHDPRQETAEKALKILQDHPKIKKEDVDQLLADQKKYEEKGIYYPIGFLALQNKNISHQEFEDQVMFVGMNLRLGEQLVCKGLLTIEELSDALERQYKFREKKVYIPLGELLIQLELITKSELDRAINEIGLK